MAVAVALLVYSSRAFASDFSGILYFFWGVSAVLVLVMGVIAYYATRGRKNIVYRSLFWGTLIALAATPLSTEGGNGTSSGPPILDIVVSTMGGDPIYATSALKALLLSVPLCSLLVAAVIWVVTKVKAASAGGADT